jgi:outer membrane cobalamin receptor
MFLSGGVRFDHSSNYGDVLTPGAGLNYAFHNHTLRFSYAEAFRAPKPWDYTDGLGNSSLLPERMISYEAALALSIIDDCRFDAIGYMNTLKHAIVKDVSSQGYRWTNSGRVNTDGIELSLRYGSQKIKSSINYTFNQSYDELHNVVPEISKHTGNAGMTYSLAKNWKLNLRANYIGERENPKIVVATDSRDIGPYVIFHGALIVEDCMGFDIQLVVKNLFNQEYYDTSNRDPDRYRQPQRTIMISVGYALAD